MLLNSLQPPGQPPTTQPISGAGAEKPCDRHLCLAPECQAKGQGPHSASETLPTSPLFPSPLSSSATTQGSPYPTLVRTLHVLSQLSGTVLLGPQEPLQPPPKEAPLSRRVPMACSLPSADLLTVRTSRAHL